MIITLRRAQKFGDTGPYKNFDFLFNLFVLAWATWPEGALAPNGTVKCRGHGVPEMVTPASRTTAVLLGFLNLTNMPCSVLTKVFHKSPPSGSEFLCSHNIARLSAKRSDHISPVFHLGFIGCRSPLVLNLRLPHLLSKF